MKSGTCFLDLGAWAASIGAVLRQALDPSTPVDAHRELAEKVSEYLEEGALLGDRAADGEVPWRALVAGDDSFLALEDGFALARFDAANLISLRVETFDGRRWSVLHTGRGLAAFRQAAMGRGSGAEAAIRVEAFAGGQLRFSHEFRSDGSDSETSAASPAVPSPLELPAQFAPEFLGCGAALLRRALESLEAARRTPEPEVPASEVDPPPPKRLSALEEAEQALLGLDGFVPPAPAAAPAKWRLVGLTGPLAGQVLSLGKGAVVIGRDPGADIHLENATVSRRHAELRRTDQGWILEDLGSANGTWIAGNQVQHPVLLAGKEHFRLGECAFLLEQG